MPVLLLLGFVITETWLLVAIGAWIGVGWVMLWLLLASLLGAALIARGGAAALRGAQASMARGELPGPALFEALVGALAGVLLILPGFITDALAIALLIFGRLLRRRLARLLSVQVARMRPDLRAPVTIEGEIVRRPPAALR